MMTPDNGTAALKSNRERIEQLAGIAVLALLVVGVFAVLRPFFASLLWALILSMATWPLFRWIEKKLGGRPTAAATVMTLLLLVALLGPLALVASSLTQDVGAVSERVKVLREEGMPPPPGWLIRVPVIGDDLTERWQSYADDPSLLGEAIKQYIRPAIQYTLGVGASLGGGLAQMTLSVLIAWFFYRDGLAGARRLGAVVHKLAGERGPHLIELTGATLKGVVYGIVGTAFAQGSLAGIGFWLAGVPGAFLLGVLTAFLSVVPMGPVLLWLPAAAWLFFQVDAIGWAIFLVVWGIVVVGGVENLIKPIFIGRGSQLPLILVFIGILGGAVAFGFLGLFIGPTLLALGYALVREWAPATEPPDTDKGVEMHEEGGRPLGRDA
jgi:predicted PurR-regulated permease PerM